MGITDGSSTALAMQGMHIFYSMMTNISKMRSDVGHTKRNRVLMSWYVWFMGEFFFWQYDEYVAYIDVFAISKVGEGNEVSKQKPYVKTQA